MYPHDMYRLKRKEKRAKKSLKHGTRPAVSRAASPALRPGLNRDPPAQAPAGTVRPGCSSERTHTACPSQPRS
eukprot:scaffold21992_cov100-Phaeocystis_antarctica.AAC.4